MTSHAIGHVPQFSLRALLITVLIVALGVGVLTSIRHWVRSVQDSVEQHYAVSHVADMILYFQATHEGSSPDTWEDLRPTFDFVKDGYNQFTFEQLKNRVDIDFARLTDNDSQSWQDLCTDVLSEK